MVLNRTINRVNETWERCNREGLIMLSLSFQVFLILAAPFRKRKSGSWLIFLIWSSYLLADFAALFTIGLISDKQNDNLTVNSKRSTPTFTTTTSTSNTRSASDHKIGDTTLSAIWAPFCLLHLGGPDTITAFSSEDNTLYPRHLLKLIIQVVVVVYTFIESLPENKLWLPISFILVAGIVKYAERIRALYLANLKQFEGLPGPSYEKLMEEYAAKREARVPTKIRMVEKQRKEKSVVEEKTSNEDPMTGVMVVQHAYYFFSKFMNLIVDQLVLLVNDRNESRKYFNERSAEDALRVISVELNFFYEVLYTKALVVNCKRGYFFRFMSYIAVIIAFTLFLVVEKHKFRSVDVKITYILFGGAIVLDTVALFMLVFSDWTAAAPHKKGSHLAQVLGKYYALKFPKSESKNFWGRARKILFRRWSESVSTFNFMDYCLKELPRVSHWRTFCTEVIRVLQLKEFVEWIFYVTKRPLDEKLWEFIFKELKSKAEFTEDHGMEKYSISSKWGDWIQLTYADLSHGNLINSDITKMDYEQSLMLWHIATELCDNFDDTSEGDKTAAPSAAEHREFSNLLSGYMLYLLLMQPRLMSSVAGVGRKCFGDTCAEAHRFFSQRGRGQFIPNEACKRILKVHTEDYKPASVKGSKCKSVLFDACILAKELRKMNTDERWKFLSKVWVGLLSYAACRCRPNPHLEFLGKGGELITIVWLLMAHFGIGKQLYVTEDHATAKLIVNL